MKLLDIISEIKHVQKLTLKNPVTWDKYNFTYESEIEGMDIPFSRGYKGECLIMQIVFFQNAARKIILKTLRDKGIPYEEMIADGNYKIPIEFFNFP